MSEAPLASTKREPVEMDRLLHQRISTLRQSASLPLNIRGPSVKRKVAPTIPLERKIKTEATEDAVKPNNFTEARKRKFEKKKTNFIQSHSIFESGMPCSIKKTDSVRFSNSDYPREVKNVSIYIKHDNFDVNKKDDVFDDVKMAPVHLPLVKGENMQKSCALVKNEPHLDFKAGIKTTCLSHKPVDDFTEMFKDNRFFLFQLPDSLPLSSSDDVKKDLVTVSDAACGKLGKLCIYKSGKCKLKMNKSDIEFNVSCGTKSAFLQKVITLNMSEHIMACLGDIEAKLIVTPDFKTLLQNNLKIA